MVDDSYTKLLLHCNGADGSTTITDESGKTITPQGDAQLDTAQKKFGSASLLLDGTGDKIDAADHVDFYLADGNFTFDFWIRTNSIANYDTFFSKYYADNSAVKHWYKFDMGEIAGTNIRPRFYAYNTTTGIVAGYEVESGVTVNDGNWHHIALVRNGTSVYIFIDGDSKTLITVTAISTTSLGDSDGIFSIGDDNGNSPRYYDGWIDEFRFSKGIARWTADFTPPTAEYAPSSSSGFFLFL